MRPIRRAARRALEGLVATYLLPTPCFGCGRLLGADQYLGACAACWSSLLPAPPSPEVRAAVLYRGFARRVVLRAKLRGRRELLAPLASQLAASVVHGAAFDGPEIVVPVPPHPWTRLVRGFDPALDLARAVARATGGELARGVLRRRWGAPAALKRLGAAGRRRAAARAFRCARAACVAGRAVLLVDDVWTTGATARACARLLLAAGANSVAVVVWARTPPPRGGEPRRRSV